MFEHVRVVGRGPVGSAIAARLQERGVAVQDARHDALQDNSADLVLLCVPDSTIRSVASGDRSTVEAHLAAIRAHAPELEAMYLAPAGVTAG
jgi:nucleoside-diphosphate-sugar epimerase